jgi:trimeric autotransporter adhesin
MRKSQSSARRRLAAVGLTTGAIAAAVLVAPGAAFAAATASPAVGPASGTITVTDSATSFTTAPGAAQFQAGATCNATALATNTTSVFAASSVAKTDANTVTVGVPATLALAANGVAKGYAICFYAAATVGSAAVTTSSVPAYTVANASGTVSPTSGASGGGNTITVTAPTTAPYFTGVATPSVVFSTSACNSVYPTSPSSTLIATATKTPTTSNTVVTVPVPGGVLGTGTTAAAYNVCFYNGTTQGTSALLGSSTYNVTLPAVTLNSTVGASTGGAGIIATSTANFLTGVSSLGAAFTTAATCPTTYPAAATYAAGPPVVPGVVLAAANTVRVLGNNKLAATVPALPLSLGTPTVYQACFYNGTTQGTSTILAAASYSSTTVPTPTSVTPNAGPARGGTTITVSGTNFPTTAGAITATLGGTALASITPVSSTAFTAVTPNHSVMASAPLIVTTSAGSATLQGAFSFTNALEISPNTAPSTSTAVNMDVLGAGFTQLPGTFAIYLVDGVYDSTPNPDNPTNFANGPVAACTNVLVVTDSELICTMQLNRRLLEDGSTLLDGATYSNTVADVVTTIGSPVITSATGSFSAADVGRPIIQATPVEILGTSSANTTYITAVTSPWRAVMSKPAAATSAGAGISATIGGLPVRAAFSGTTAANGNAVTATAGSFSNSDVGRAISGAAATTIAAGTTITGVNAAGTVATLSQPVGGGGTGLVSVFVGSAVPDGAYNLTIVSHGALSGAADNPSTYTQTAVSSGSTFTVAPF